MRESSYLVVDDESCIRDLIEAVFRDKACVTKACDDKEALNPLQQREFDRRCQTEISRLYTDQPKTILSTSQKRLVYRAGNVPASIADGKKEPCIIVGSGRWKPFRLLKLNIEYAEIQQDNVPDKAVIILPGSFRAKEDHIHAWSRDNWTPLLSTMYPFASQTPASSTHSRHQPFAVNS